MTTSGLSLPLSPGITFTVVGEPIPQGSTRGFVVGRRAIITSDNPRTRPWRALVADAALQAGAVPVSGPVSVEATFTMRRPGSRPRRDIWPDRRPDLDKLCRALLDALTGCCWVDDSQVVMVNAQKVYVGHEWALAGPGALVTVAQVLA